LEETAERVVATAAAVILTRSRKNAKQVADARRCAVDDSHSFS